MVIDTPATAAEDIVLVEVGDDPAVVRFDDDTGWGDGATLCSWHGDALMINIVVLSLPPAMGVASDDAGWGGRADCLRGCGSGNVGTTVAAATPYDAKIMGHGARQRQRFPR